MFNAACGYAVNQINLAHPVITTVAPWLMLVWGENQMPAPRWIMSRNIVRWFFRLGVHIKTLRKHSHLSIALKRKDEHVSWVEPGSHLRLVSIDSVREYQHKSQNQNHLKRELDQFDLIHVL